MFHFIFFFMLFFFIHFSISIEDCYVNYSSNGCQTCLSRTYESCGFCINMQQCLPGTSSGPLKEECTSDLWVFPKDKCTNDICHMSKEKMYCKSPCIWNNAYSECVLPRDTSVESAEELRNKKHSSDSTRIIIACFIVFVVTCISIYVYGVYYSKKSKSYSALPNDQDTVPLDQL